jgi:hypothetical protein
MPGARGEPMTTETIPKAEWVYEALLTPTATERFWSKVDRRGPDECWPWTASTSAGYGQFTVWVDQHRTNLKSHRAVWMLTYGPVPVDRQVNHTCDNALCCNPAHLEPGTQTENIADATRKGRMASCGAATRPEVIPYGEKHYNARLTVAKVIELRRRFESGEKLTLLAKEFGIDCGHASAVANRKKWKQVP